MADERALSPSLCHETDILILDYLIFNATETLLHVASRRVNGITSGNRSAVEGELDEVLLQLHLVESFLTIYKYAHSPREAVSSLKQPAQSHESIPNTLSFRLQLLRFMTLFALRHSSNATTPSPISLQDLRRRNTARAQRWRARDATLSNSSLDFYMRDDDNADGPETVMLLDLIPSFLALTASRAQLAVDIEEQSNGDDADEGSIAASGWSPGQRWLELVADMMLQAVLERVQALSKVPHNDTDMQLRLSEVVDEAFAWGLPSVNSGGDALDSSDATQEHYDELLILLSESSRTSSAESAHQPEELYPTSPSASVPPSHPVPGSTFCALRDQRLSLLNPFLTAHKHISIDLTGSPTTSQTQRFRAFDKDFQKLVKQYPMAAYEAQMLGFLSALHQGIEERPLLVELEEQAEGDGEDTMVDLMKILRERS